MKKHIFSFLSMAALTAFFASTAAIDSASFIPFWVCLASLVLFGAFAKIYEKMDGEEEK